jgi:lipopolysaccharide/colanic/teichoic acid biosynthesis glycosyltransferase
MCRPPFDHTLPISRRRIRPRQALLGNETGNYVIQEAAASTTHLSRPPAAIKRTFDVVFASVALVALTPLLLCLMAAIWCESPGNPLFVQERMGFNGRPFRLLKLRTMVPNAEAALGGLAHLNEVQSPLFKVRRDPRVTRLGRFLRITSLDELPQLVNVLRGEMSLVGPRPPLIREVSQYTVDQARRLTVTPGLTGLWQVSGRSNRSFDDLVALDLYYIDHWSFRLDLQLIAKTLWVVVTCRGAY